MEARPACAHIVANSGFIYVHFTRTRCQPPPTQDSRSPSPRPVLKRFLVMLHVCSCVDLAGEAALGQGPSHSGFIARSAESSVDFQTCVRTTIRRRRRAWLPRRRRFRRCICSRAFVHAHAHGGCIYMPRTQEPAYPPKKRKAPDNEAACIVACRSSSHVKQHCAGGATAAARSSATGSPESGLHAAGGAMLAASGTRSSDCKQLCMYSGFLSLVLSTSIVISGQGPEGAERAPVARVPRTWRGRAPLGVILFLSIQAF